MLKSSGIYFIYIARAVMSAKIYRKRYIDCFKQMVPGFRLWARFKHSVIKPIISKYTSQPEKISKNDSE